jgi:hypothetical protein
LNVDFAGLYTGSIIVLFADYLEAQLSATNLNAVCPQWRITLLAPRALARQRNFPVANVSDFHGQLVVSVHFDRLGSTVRFRPVLNILRQLLASNGDVKALKSLRASVWTTFCRKFRVEYFDTRAADAALVYLSHKAVDVNTPLQPQIHSLTFFTRVWSSRLSASPRILMLFIARSLVITTLCFQVSQVGPT